MVQQLFLLVRMLLYPAMGAVVFDGYTSFDPETGVYAVNIGQMILGLLGYGATWLASRTSWAVLR